ncbi:hypothetical protein [Pseudomonas oryzihabitans]|uniref:hypothetical protein n=1 Tax=Pseudomonas oryzihabitans TaxID=47885 RepID=UPI002420182E|nr:hypothetical protein [Pseudomonas oryzihabitans]
MNDEQFEAAIQEIELAGYYSISEALQDHNTAQREALEQMKAERDQYDELHLDSIALAARCKAQLAEVLYILGQHRAWTGMGWEQLPVPVHAVEKIRSKLAQAEQQEVRGAQAGDERAKAEQAYVEGAFDYSAAPIGSRDWTLYWKGWQDRAALATQPAVRGAEHDQ